MSNSTIAPLAWATLESFVLLAPPKYHYAPRLFATRAEAETARASYFANARVMTVGEYRTLMGMDFEYWFSDIYHLLVPALAEQCYIERAAARVRDGRTQEWELAPEIRATITAYNAALTTTTQPGAPV